MSVAEAMASLSIALDPLVNEICRGRPAGPWTLGDLITGFASWMVMIVAMMGPVCLPWVVTFHRQAGGTQGSGSAAAATALFAGSYVVVWSTFGVLVVAFQWWLSTQVGVGAELLRQHPVITGLALVLTGAYQLTPLKQACLNHCDSPVVFFLRHWREGRWGTLTMGLRHGLYCIGCCWALMVLMLVTGTMSLLWMVGLTLFVLAEMYSPRPRWLSRGAGIALILFGLQHLLSR